MNRRILIQVTAPAVVIGLLLVGACLIGIWQINRLQANMAHIIADNVTSLRASQQLEINVRRLRFHCFLYLATPNAKMLERIHHDHDRFEEWLERAQQRARTPEELRCVRAIEVGYLRYRQEFDRQSAEVARSGPYRDLNQLGDSHPVQHVIDPCRELLRLNEEQMEQTFQDAANVGGQVRTVMQLLGILGPLSGIIIGYGIARGLSRSIYQLSVRVQNMAQRLDQDVASVSVAADGDIQNLDKQLQHIVARVEEVAERLQRQQRDMLRAEQLSAVGQLAASVAHEVRNPLAGIKLLVEAAQRPRNPMPLTGEDLDVIHREIARLEQTVQGFLDFARLPTPRRSVVDLRQMITQAIDLVNSRARQQRVEIAISSPEGPVQAHVDVNQINTVLVNLLINALDALPHGGRIEVGLENAGGGEVRLTVHDSGPGIAPDIQNRLFTPFASTKATGTGLGLSICRRIVEEHGGRIAAENGPDGGACFRIELPESENVGHGQGEDAEKREKDQKSLAGR